MPNDWDARGQPGRNDPAIRRAICGRLPACRAVGRCPKTAPVGLLLAAAVRSGGSKKSPRSSKLGRGRGLLSYRPPFFVLGQRRLFGWGRARAELGHHTVVADAKSILWPMCAFDAPPTQLRWPRRRAGGGQKTHSWLLWGFWLRGRAGYSDRLSASRDRLPSAIQVQRAAGWTKLSQ
jgi:hypothetical protein